MDPRNDGAFVNRGIAYRRAGDIERAIRDYDEAIRLNPRAADAFNNRGNAFRALDDPERAMRDYDEALRLDPHYAHAYNNRGIIFLEMDEVDRAIADFNKAIAEEPGYANAFRNRGLAWLQQRLFDRANEDFDEASRLSRQQAVSLKPRARERAHDDAVLPEPSFQILPKTAPPRAVELARHHFEDHDVVARCFAGIVSPESAGRRSHVGRDAAESIGELGPQLHEIVRLEVVPFVIVHGKKNLDQVHVSQLRLAVAATSESGSTRAPFSRVLQ